MIRRARQRAPHSALGAAFPPWLAARAVVLGALALAHYLVAHLHPPPAVALRVHEGLLGWDAGYYRDIALKGYAALPRPALRFFPLLPLVTRWLHQITRLSIDDVLLVVTNLSALAGGALLYRLVVRETGNERLARLATWVIALLPSGFVLVMGYSEAPMILLSVGFFLALRSGRPWAAAAAGYLTGLTRPVGALLALPGAVEALGLGRRRPVGLGPLGAEADDVGAPFLPGLSGTGVVSRLAVVVAPGLGTLTYLTWTGFRFGHFWAPVQAQEQGNLRGHFADPFLTAFHDLRDLGHGHIGTGLHVPWLVLFVLLALVSLWRWPTAYGAYAVATLALAVSSTNFDSLERYALGAFPLALAGAGLLRGERRERLVLSLLGGVLMAYSLLAFLGALVP